MLRSVKSLSALLQRRFDVVLLFSFMLGLAFPALGGVPSSVLAALMGFQIFLTSFRISHHELRSLRIREIAAFYLLRFVVFPAMLFMLFEAAAPHYSIAVLLLALMPPASSGPAIISLCGGNVSLGFALLISGSFITPLAVPLVFLVMTGEEVPISAVNLFINLLCMLFLPLVLHLPLRRVPAVTKAVHRFGSFMVVPIVGFAIAASLAREREYFFTHPTDLLGHLVVSLMVYLLFYLVGWFASMRRPLDQRVSLTLSSGLNNGILGVVLATLHFGEVETGFAVIAAIAWSFALIPFRRFLTTLLKLSQK